MAIVNATGAALAALQQAFTRAQRHGHIPRRERFRSAYRHVGPEDNQYEALCLDRQRHRLPVRPEPFRRLITDSTPLAPLVRRSSRSDRFVYLTRRPKPAPRRAVRRAG